MSFDDFDLYNFSDDFVIVKTGRQLPKIITIQLSERAKNTQIKDIDFITMTREDFINYTNSKHEH